ncbi:MULTISPECIES: hypothetical protein [unclassified Microcoleus]|uniref:hypothetical protein n=1 Tax=unclassified Microcoleus TaxID=2642155 RepID=UPI002FD0A701
MSRLVYVFGRKGQDPSEKPPDAAKENLLSVMTCKTRTAEFLDIGALQYKSTGAMRPRKQYTKSVLGANGTATSIQVPAGEVIYMPSTKAMAKTVTLKTGAKTTVTGQKSNYRTIAMTFGASVTVGQIAEFLAEIIPEVKIQRTAALPSATEIFPQFTIKGGRTYPIGLKAAAETSVDVDVPNTPAEQEALLGKAK